MRLHIAFLLFAMLFHLTFRRAKCIAQGDCGAFMCVITRAFMRYHHFTPWQGKADMHTPQHALMLVPMRRFQHHIAAREARCTAREVFGFMPDARLQRG